MSRLDQRFRRIGEQEAAVLAGQPDPSHRVIPDPAHLDRLTESTSQVEHMRQVDVRRCHVVWAVELLGDRDGLARMQDALIQLSPVGHHHAERIERANLRLASTDRTRIPDRLMAELFTLGHPAPRHRKQTQPTQHPRPQRRRLVGQQRQARRYAALASSTRPVLKQ